MPARNWYIAPVYANNANGWCPGEGDGSVGPINIPGMIVHAYDPDPSVVLVDPDPTVEGDEVYQTPTTCLVGSPNDESSRPGWAAQTLQQAKDHFATIHGYTPTVEVQ